MILIIWGVLFQMERVMEIKISKFLQLLDTTEDTHLRETRKEKVLNL